MSKIEVDKVDPQSGTALEIGTSGDTVTVPSGVGLTLTNATLLLPTTVTATTEVKTNKISPATGTAFALGDSGDTFTVPSGATIVNSGTATGFGGGKVLQVVSATQTGKESITGDADWQDATNLTLSITCAATSSKVLVLANVSLSCDARYGVWRILRDATPISVGVKAVSEDEVSGGSMTNIPEELDDRYVNYANMVNYLDSPSSTSALTYKIQVRNSSDLNATQYVNVPSVNSTAGYIARTASTITAIEIGA